ncbi:hypothetical protein EVAR_28629_1 [Eumeta japonica]|uniref:Uncharacterized protein n=1 Tax=Eumeta variegata TaxID=151549 RepID=A0A4C1XS98_EUMVA|nr:hypothetical protein EVAR_28629_1 [Eumeta japonica]
MLPRIDLGAHLEEIAPALKTKQFCNKLAGICRPLYLALLFVATVIVCMSSVKIAISACRSQNKLSQETMKYYVHGCAFILVILMFSMLAQKLDDETNLKVSGSEIMIKYELVNELSAFVKMNGPPHASSSALTRRRWALRSRSDNGRWRAPYTIGSARRLFRFKLVAHMEDALLEKWYLYDERHKTDVKIFKIALRRGIHTYLFGSATLSLASFTWVRQYVCVPGRATSELKNYRFAK